MEPEEIDPADLAALEQLVQYGLADVVTIDGEPRYALGSRFVPGTRRSRRLEPEPSAVARRAWSPLFAAPSVVVSPFTVWAQP
jgi:hypothetical protein